jgi:hypothetical protein
LGGIVSELVAEPIVNTAQSCNPFGSGSWEDCGHDLIPWAGGAAVAKGIGTAVARFKGPSSTATAAATGTLIRRNGFFGSSPTHWKNLNSGGYWRDAGRQDVAAYISQATGGQAAADRFFSLQTGAARTSAAEQTATAGGLRYTVRTHSTAGPPTVDVFDAVARTVEKVRFNP